MAKCNTRTCPKPSDMRIVLRLTAIRRIAREFMAGASVRDLARKYGLSGEGVCRALRLELRQPR